MPDQRYNRSPETSTAHRRPLWTWTDCVGTADVPPLTKLVCLTLARFFPSAAEGCHLTVPELMAETGLSNRAIAAHVKNAVDAGLLTVRRCAPEGRRTGTIYTPRFPPGMVPPEPGSAPPVEDVSTADVDNFPEPYVHEPPSREQRPQRDARATRQSDPRSRIYKEDSRFKILNLNQASVDNAARWQRTLAELARELGPAWDVQALHRSWKASPWGANARYPRAAFAAWARKVAANAKRRGQPPAAKLRISVSDQRWTALLAALPAASIAAADLALIERRGYVDVSEAFLQRMI